MAFLVASLLTQTPADPGALQRSVDELRGCIGRWDVTTDALNEDGSVASSVAGTYEFFWIAPDRVVSGRSDMPDRKQAAGILFYIDEKRQVIEMVSVGNDGRSWIMTGPLGGDRRTSQEFETAGGGTARLRFTRSNVAPDSFESRMDYTEDGGKTWKPANHQRFRRAAPAKD